MDENKLLERITVNPQIFGGEPIIRGRRLAVEHVVRMLAAGDTVEDILKAYPRLQHEDIRACLVYAPDRNARKEKAALAGAEIQDYLKLLPKLKESREGLVWMSYAAAADTLYVNYKKPSLATDGELTDGDVLIRYEGEEVAGFTILHASQRDLKS